PPRRSRRSVAMSYRDQQVLPLPELQQQLSRRDFCQAAVVGVAALALPACGVGDDFERVGTGAIDPEGNPIGPDFPADSVPPDFANVNPPVDMAHHPVDLKGSPPVDLKGAGPVDLAHAPPPPDLSQPVMANCPGGIYDTGKAPSAFGANTATYFS